METIETVDVSWLHHSQKDHLHRCKSVSSVVSEKPSAESETTAALPPPPTRSVSDSARSDFPTLKKTPSHDDGHKSEEKAGDDVNAGGSKSSGSTPAFQKAFSKQQNTSRSPTGRRNSWISSLSAKFSSSSTPPSQPNSKASPTPPKVVVPGGAKLDFHNPFGAAYSPKDKEEESKEDANTPLTSSPRGPSFLQNAFRKLSSSGPIGQVKSIPNNVVCERRVMNVDSQRDRCRIPGLNQGKLRRVAFCVDVEIAGVSRRESDEEVPTNRDPNFTSSARLPYPESIKPRKADLQSKGNSEAPTTDSSTQVTAVPSVEKNNISGSGSPANERKVNIEAKEPTRKQEKKKRSEEERKERKEKKRRHAVANGIIPLQLNENDEDDSATVTRVSRSRAQALPTTDPVRIYRRCCQLRETRVLKGVVDQISLPSSTLAESPGTVAVLDLSNFIMTSEDVVTFSDWLAVVPVRKLILENCALTDSSVQAILAGLLSTKTVEQMRSRRRRTTTWNSQSPTRQIEQRFGVVEKVSLKNNPDIGPEGWRYICLFVHLSRSLKAIDLSGIPFPKSHVPANGTEQSFQAQKPSNDLTTLFAQSLAERFGGDRLDELLVSECNPSTEDVRKICDASIAVGLRRLGLANSGLTRDGLAHVMRYFNSGKCEGLDLGGNDLRDNLDLLTSSFNKNCPLYAISLADCSLAPSVMPPLLQGLTRLPNLRFVDFSHNIELFSNQPDALVTFRRYLPKMPLLKRIHLADVNLSPNHVIALAEVLSECPSLCHLSVLENTSIAGLASATGPGSQEEACAVYASLMAAVRVSRTIIAVDIEVPSEECNEVVKGLASQIVAYSLRNLEHGAMEEFPNPADASSEPPVRVPEVLQRLVGHADGEEAEDEDDPTPDEDYVIGGTGVVKALGVCLGTMDNPQGDLSVPPSGASTPKHRKQKSIVAKKPHDMSKNLLESARNIRSKVQLALVREDRAGNDANYSRLQILDFALNKMIHRFEDTFPETRIIPQMPPSITLDSSSQHSSDNPNGGGHIGAENDHDNENAIDDEDDVDHYDITLSRSSSMTSLHSRAMTSEEGEVHRLGQNLRRDFLSPSLDRASDHLSSSVSDESHIIALREKLECLQGKQAESSFETVSSDKTIEDLGTTVDELWDTQRQDAEAFSRFRQSQIAAQINSGKVSSPTMDGAGQTATQK